MQQPYSPYKEEVWQQLVQETDAEIVTSGFWNKQQVQKKAGPWMITLDEYIVHSKPAKITYTRLRAPFVSTDGFRFKLYDETFFSAVGKAFGMQDVQIGEEIFDAKFILKTNNEARLRQLFGNNRIRQMISLYHHVHFAIRGDENWFGTRLPTTVDELYFRTPITVRNVEGLRTLFEIFTETLQQLCEIGTATPQSPDIKL